MIEDGNSQLAEVALNRDGQATSVLSLPGGDHALRAVFMGDASHLSSASVASNVTGQASATPNFSITLAAVAPASLPLTLTAGASGSVAVTIEPEDNAALTAPMFVTLSCSGLRLARIGLPARQLDADSDAGAFCRPENAALSG